MNMFASNNTSILMNSHLWWINHFYKKSTLILLFLIFTPWILFAQENTKSEISSSYYLKGKDKDLFGTTKRFIENVGQYGETYKNRPEMGKILYAYEGFEVPVLFTERGVIYLHRKIKNPKRSEEEEMAAHKRHRRKESEVFEQKAVESTITLQWKESSSNPIITACDKFDSYHTYGILQAKANAYAKIKYANLYPGIDLVFNFIDAEENGFEFSLIVQAGADLSLVKMLFGGDLKKIEMLNDGGISLLSPYGEIKQSVPVCYYETELQKDLSVQKTVASKYAIKGKQVNFCFPQGYDVNRSLIIDPFISSTGNSIGTNLGKAKDVDFDYAGNVYVTGGGDGNVHKLAKFNSAGVAQWTYSGTVAVPAWNFGPYYGGWVVEKSTGSVYLGQGFNAGTGYQVIKVNSSGLYDNYISTGNVSANEDWKMFWSCNNGSPQILVAGGGTSGNLNLGVLTPPSTIINGKNLTGIVGGCCQDMVDLAYDPANFDIYTIYASLGGTPFVNNRIYKNASPYSAATSVWNVLSGYTSLSEANNRPYLAQVGATFSDNSANILAVNSSYLYYYDGKNLKAFDKTTGAAVGTALTIAANTVMMQGGIEADECNNVFIGSTNGTIKVYQFNGSTFNDAAAADISIAGFATKSVYDLVINEGQHLLYTCGDGFLAAYDISSYACGSAVYSLQITSDCANRSASATIIPAPPANSMVTYVLYNGASQISSNTSGNFSSLIPNLNYTIHAFVNQACSGNEVISNFTLLGPTINLVPSHTSCGQSAGALLVNASGGLAPLEYSLDGISFQSSANFTALNAGIYVVTVRDASGCSNSASATIINSNGPTVSLSKTDASCGATMGTITAIGAGGNAPYSYSLDGIIYQVSPLFAGLLAGNYQVSIKDANNCINTAAITINSIGNTIVNAVVISASCGNSNGSISGNVSGGTPPYQYSLDGITFQNSNIFTGLANGNYVLTTKDADNCINSKSFTVTNLAGPIISASSNPTSCNGLTGIVTVNASGNLPLQYSINGGVTFQVSNVFTGLAAGNYTVIVRDANACLSTTSVNVNLSLPQVTDSTTFASCTINDGTITAIGIGGSLPYQYSIDGINFQPNNVFTGLGAGSYTLTIIDLNGCRNSISPVIVTNASGLTISAQSTKTACIINNGSISATATGGQAPLQYSIDGINYQASPLFNGLAAAAYLVYVKDANNCVATVASTVSKISTPSVTATTTSASCNSSIGSIAATGISGLAPYTYSINGTNFFASSVFSNLSPGPYTVTVKDANSCTNTTSVLVANVGAGSGPTVTATADPAECGQANGRINGNGSGGNNPKQYSINGVNYQGSTNFSNLLPGTYTLYVRDASGCINFTTVVVPNIAGPQVSATTTPAVCGLSNGTITATGFAGTPNYRYSIDGGINFQNSSIFSGLPGGFYTVTVRDADNVCRNSIVVYIGNSNGPSLALLKTDATCSVNNGSITANGAGGIAPLSYSLDGVNFQTSNQFIGLSPGQYAVTVKDASNCSNISSATIAAVSNPQISLVSTSSTCGDNNASITVTGTGGTLPYTYTIDGVNFQLSALFSSLSPGAYSITLKDANSCIANSNSTLIDIPGPQIATSQVATTCQNSNGTLLVAANGGTTPYSYSLDGIAYQNSFVFSGQASGSGTVFVKDANNCVTSANYSISAGPTPHVAVVDSESVCGGNLKTVTIGGAAPYQYSINNGPLQSSAVFPCLQPGTYLIKVFDSNGCMDSLVYLLEETLPIELIAFSGYAETNYNMLEWSTASETDNEYFTVERSKDATAFEIAGILPGAGNSSSILNYNLKDKNPYPGLNYYRLKQTCSDGDFHYSYIIAILSKRLIDFDYNYNPVQNLLTVHEGTFYELESIELIDPLGRKVYDANFDEIVHSINTEGIKKGIYFLRLLSRTETYNFKLIIY